MTDDPMLFDATPEPLGVPCPRCGCCDQRVVETRRKRGRIVRIRNCRHCGKRIITTEHVQGDRQSRHLADPDKRQQKLDEIKRMLDELGVEEPGNGHDD